MTIAFLAFLRYNMKKIASLSESDFLKLVFGCITAAFLIAALCMPDRSSLVSGYYQILTQTSKISTNYFAVGGYAATFLNVGLVGLFFLALFVGLDAPANNVSTLAFLLTLGFSTWGIHLLNLLPTVAGVCLYCLVRREKCKANVNAMLFSTGIAPIITDLMIRYPNAEVIGYNPVGIALGIVVGLAIGFFLPFGLPHSPKVHKGYDLYSAALPVGMMAFFLQAMLFKTMGVALPAAPSAETLSVASQSITNIFCGVVFGGCVVAAFAMGCSAKDYWQLLKDPEMAGSFSGVYGNAAFLMNLGVYGLFILGYYNLIGASFNGITFGIIFCMLSCCNSGSSPRTVLPIVAGYVAASCIFQYLSELAGGSFGGAVNAQAIMVGLCFANGLSPISRKFGWEYGVIAGMMHYVLVTSVPNLHGGYCLYNGGFTAVFICILLVPVLEKTVGTVEERQKQKTV